MRWFSKKAKRCDTLEQWVLSNFDTLPSEASGRELAQHFSVMLKAYGQSPENSLQILAASASVFTTEMLEEEAKEATKH